jgi:putative PIN family toxin of toxin-antitoxin system
MTLRVVLDTNVVVSAFIKQHGKPAMVLRLGLARIFQLCISEAILLEYETVLRRPKFKRPPELVTTLIAALREEGELVQPTERLKISGHESDNRFYECAAEAGADYIVTGNEKHFKKPYKTTKIVTARQFLEILAEGHT